MEDFYKQEGVRKEVILHKRAVLLLQSYFPLGMAGVYQAHYLTSTHQEIPDWLI